MGFLLIQSEDKVSFLKSSALDVSIMVTPQILLIERRSDEGELSPLFQKVDTVLPSGFGFSFII